MDDSNRVKLVLLQGRGLTVDASLMCCRERKVVCTPWSGLALTLALASAAVDFAISLPKLYHLFSQALRRCCSYISSDLFFLLLSEFIAFPRWRHPCRQLPLGWSTIPLLPCQSSTSLLLHQQRVLCLLRCLPPPGPRCLAFTQAVRRLLPIHSLLCRIIVITTR
jgi:hypothetical protein